MAKSTVTKTDDLTASAEDTLPTREQMVAQVEEATDPNMVAKVDAPKTVKVTSPVGTTTEVPEGIVDALLESGYSKSK
jgi:hypothetical protein